ncbi:MAG: hypothetical protein H0X43_02745 [Nitrosospira sp.]|nr:hypothetical protein [Nitrosospira sp.]
MCSPKIPKPDAAIGEAAMKQAEIAGAMQEIARDQLAWERERAKVQDPLIDKIVNQQIESGDANSARAEEQWKIYRDLFHPLEQRMVDDANNLDSGERKSRVAAEAGADVTRGYQGALDQSQRQMARIGINPSFGRFQVLTQEMNLGKARDTAGAMNQARLNADLQGMAMREGVAKFGRNMPSTGLAADAAALNAGNSGVGNLAANSNIRNANMSTAQNWFGGAMTGNNSAGNLELGKHQAQLNAWQTKQNSLSQALGGLGSLTGTLGGAYLMGPGLRKGGVIRRYRIYRFKPGSYNAGLSSLRRKGYAYAEGGMIEGPGTGTSDSIAARIEGVKPIRISNGEAVLNRAAVELVGEEFIHRINTGGSAITKRKTEETEGREGING